MAKAKSSYATQEKVIRNRLNMIGRRNIVTEGFVSLSKGYVEKIEYLTDDILEVNRHGSETVYLEYATQ